VENISGLLYKEEQNFPAWFYLLFFLWIPFIVIVFVINPELFKESDFMLAILLAVLFEFLIIALMGKLTILVRWNEMVGRIGFFGLRMLKIRKNEIKMLRWLRGNCGKCMEDGG